MGYKEKEKEDEEVGGRRRRRNIYASLCRKKIAPKYKYVLNYCYPQAKGQQLHKPRKRLSPYRNCREALCSLPEHSHVPFWNQIQNSALKNRIFTNLNKHPTELTKVEIVGNWTQSRTTFFRELLTCVSWSQKWYLEENYSDISLKMYSQC